MKEKLLLSINDDFYIFSCGFVTFDKMETADEAISQVSSNCSSISDERCSRLT